jgi:hypothetical protein
MKRKMPFKNLTKKEKEVVVECLKASVNGPFFDDDDFHMLFGLYRNEVLPIIEGLPDIDDSDELTMRAINNSLNNLIGFPHNKEEDWGKYISVSPAELEKIFKKWKAKE